MGKAILEEFQKEYLICSTDPEEWRGIEEKFTNRLNVPHAVGALDCKHIAMKKPKKSGSEYFNYKGHFFPGTASPGRCGVHIPVGGCGVKCFFI